jgi:hypothetical protein
MSYRFRRPDLHQEDDVIPRFRVLLALLVTLVIAAVFVVGAASMVAANDARLRPSGLFPERSLGPRRPIGRVRQDLFDDHPSGLSLDALKRSELASYGWVDRDRGVARIPIDRAMDLVVEGRLP